MVINFVRNEQKNFLLLSENSLRFPAIVSSILLQIAIKLPLTLFKNLMVLLLFLFFSGLSWGDASWHPRVYFNEQAWPPYYVDQYAFWDKVFQISSPKPSSPTAYCAGLESARRRDGSDTTFVFRTEGEAIFDRAVTAIGPMCHEFDERGNSLGGTGLALITPANYDPFKNLGGGCSPLINNGSNPINAATGNKYQQETDYQSKVGLSFSRYYNSLLSGFSLDSVVQKKIWASNYDSYVRLQTYADSDSYGSVFVYKPDGNIFVFNPNGNGGYISADANNLDKLEHLTGGGWRLIIDDDNSIENYDAVGKLLSISSRDGRMQTLNYDVNDRLITVTDDNGRALGFTYDSLGRVATLTNPSGGLYQYAYDTNNTYLPNVLTGITDENGICYAIYTYDNRGRAIVSEHANGAMRHTFNYNADRTTNIRLLHNFPIIPITN